MTRLLLFTNDYPYGSGDSVFVQKEIPALAERFDDVIVFCHARDTSAAMVDMPSNVVLGGNLFRPAPEGQIFDRAGNNGVHRFRQPLSDKITRHKPRDEDDQADGQGLPTQRHLFAQSRA